MRYQELREVWHGRNPNGRADWCRQRAGTPQHQHNREIPKIVLKKANSSMVRVLAAPFARALAPEEAWTVPPCSGVLG